MIRPLLGVDIGTVLGRGARAANGLLNNLVAYWPLNEAGGANDAPDLHTNGLTLTQQASPGADTGKVYPMARVFDGSSQYLSRADDAHLSAGDLDFTLAVWVWLNTASSDFRAVVMKGGGVGSNTEYSLDYRVSTINRWRFFVSNGALSPLLLANNAGAPAINLWYLLVAWHDAVANTINLQVDNGPPDSAGWAGGVQDTGQPFGVGANYAAVAASAFPGRIGPVAFWKSAAGAGGVLTAAQRTALWNSGKGLAYAGFTL